MTPSGVTGWEWKEEQKEDCGSLTEDPLWERQRVPGLIYMLLGLGNRPSVTPHEHEGEHDKGDSHSFGHRAKWSPAGGASGDRGWDRGSSGSVAIDKSSRATCDTLSHRLVVGTRRVSGCSPGTLLLPPALRGRRKEEEEVQRGSPLEIQYSSRQADSLDLSVAFLLLVFYALCLLLAPHSPPPPSGQQHPLRVPATCPCRGGFMAVLGIFRLLS